MGWRELAAWCTAAGVVFAAAGCGGSATSSDDQKPAGSTMTGDAGSAASGSHAGGTTAGQSQGGSSSGGSSSGGSSSGGAGEPGISGAGGSLGNVYVDMLRGREGCLPRQLPVVAMASGGFEVGQVRCSLTEVVAAAPGAACACDASQSLAATPPKVLAAIKSNARASGVCGAAGGISCDDLCACDLLQAAGAALTKCQTDTTPIAELPPGFCYVDVTLMPPIGNAALVSSCSADSKRELRILGPVSEPAPTLFLACAGASL